MCEEEAEGKEAGGEEDDEEVAQRASLVPEEEEERCEADERLREVVGIVDLAQALDAEDGNVAFGHLGEEVGIAERALLEGEPGAEHGVEARDREDADEQEDVFSGADVDKDEEEGERLRKKGDEGERGVAEPAAEDDGDEDGGADAEDGKRLGDAGETGALEGKDGGEEREGGDDELDAELGERAKEHTGAEVRGEDVEQCEEEGHRGSRWGGRGVSVRWRGPPGVRWCARRGVGRDSGRGACKCRPSP